MLSGSFPFKAPSDRELYRKISKGAFHMPNDISPQAKKLIQKILVVDSARRLQSN